MLETFGAKLAYLRRERGMSQIDVGRSLSLAASTFVNHLEAHRKAPSVEVVLGVANLFEVSIDYLTQDLLPIVPPTASKLGPSPVPPQLVGEKIKHLRKQRRFTQVILSEQLELATQAHISHLESGRHVASLVLVLRITQLFNVSTDYLLRDDVGITDIIPLLAR